MIFRKAELKDINQIKDYIFLAMEELSYYMIGKNDEELAKQFFLDMLALPISQYSYKNCYVLEENEQVIAAINIYDGEKLEMLRAPVLNYLKNNYNRIITPEDETQAGEIYIDTFGVHPNYQGKGLGTKLLQEVIQLIVVQKGKTLGLLVDDENPNAKKLYLKLGFKKQGNKTLMGHQMEHLQIIP